MLAPHFTDQADGLSKRKPRGRTAGHEATRAGLNGGSAQPGFPHCTRACFALVSPSTPTWPLGPPAAAGQLHAHAAAQRGPKVLALREAFGSA